MRVASLFSGAGGLDLGLEQAGHDIILQCESDPGCQQVLKHWFPGTLLCPDVCALEQLPLGTELVAAGFPCIDVSRAGLRRGVEGECTGLVRHIFRLLHRAKIDGRPVPWVLLENVEALCDRVHGGSPAIQAITDTLEMLGYNSWAHRMICTASFGIPSRRRRLFLVASMHGDARDVLLSQGLQTCMGACCSDGDGKKQGGCAPCYECVEPPNLDTHEGLDKCALAFDLGNARCPPGVDVCPTFTTSNSRMCLALEKQVGILRTTDAERLQGFPEGWTEPCWPIMGHGVNTHRKPTREADSDARERARHALLGNAVSVPVAAWLGERLMDPYHRKYFGFSESLMPLELQSKADPMSKSQYDDLSEMKGLVSGFLITGTRAKGLTGSTSSDSEDQVAVPVTPARLQPTAAACTAKKPSNGGRQGAAAAGQVQPPTGTGNGATAPGVEVNGAGNGATAPGGEVNGAGIGATAPGGEVNGAGNVGGDPGPSTGAAGPGVHAAGEGGVVPVPESGQGVDDGNGGGRAPGKKVASNNKLGRTNNTGLWPSCAYFVRRQGRRAVHGVSDCPVKMPYITLGQFISEVGKPPSASALHTYFMRLKEQGWDIQPTIHKLLRAGAGHALPEETKGVVQLIGEAGDTSKKGELVWAKDVIRLGSWWPAEAFDPFHLPPGIIISPSQLAALNQRERGMYLPSFPYTLEQEESKQLSEHRKVLVVFFGDKSFNWQYKDSLLPFEKHRDEKAAELESLLNSRALTCTGHYKKAMQEVDMVNSLVQGYKAHAAAAAADEKDGNEGTKTLTHPALLSQAAQAAAAAAQMDRCRACEVCLTSQAVRRCFVVRAHSAAAAGHTGAQLAVLGRGCIGARISCWWPLDEAWYTGQVVDYDRFQVRHTIIYEDGDMEVIALWAPNQLVRIHSTPKDWPEEAEAIRKSQEARARANSQQVAAAAQHKARMEEEAIEASKTPFERARDERIANNKAVLQKIWGKEDVGPASIAAGSPVNEAAQNETGTVVKKGAGEKVDKKAAEVAAAPTVDSAPKKGGRKKRKGGGQGEGANGSRKKQK